MWQQYPNTYKGFEVHPLVFPRSMGSRHQRVTNGEGYDIAVRICRPGAEGGSVESRVFRVKRDDAYPDFGDARRAASRYGEEIIDGNVAGESVKDL